MTKDNINISFSSESLGSESLTMTRKLLAILDTSFLPSPDKIDQADRKEIGIAGYLDEKIMRVAEDEWKKRQLPFVLWGNGEEFSVSIAASELRYGFTIEFPYSTHSEISTSQIKELFLILCQLLNPEIARCYARNAFNSIRQKHFEWECRTPNLDYFSWLQYFGKNEFRRQGGEAIFQNPYIKAEWLGEGVLIEVGSEPLEAHTPEGEELIVKATRALPPVVKD
jgi:hypothetical protein